MELCCARVSEASNVTRYADLDGLEIAYETFGDAGDPTVLLVAGLGGQLISWDDDVCQRLADLGWRVVRYDNRDVGLSTHLSHLGPPDLVAVSSGRLDTVGYRLADMAADAAGLLDHLGVGRAHPVQLFDRLVELLDGHFHVAEQVRHA